MQASTGSLLDNLGNLYLLAADKTPTIVDYLSKQTLQNLLVNSADQWQFYGINAGDTVALLSHNHLLYLPLLLSAVQHGITIVPVNWHLSGSEIEFVLHDCKAKRVITDQNNLTGLSQTPCIAIDDFFSTTDINTKQAISNTDANLNNSIGNIMLYTSGTTGKPKGVVRAGADNWPEQIKQWRLLGNNLGLKGQGRHLVTGPLYHAAPLFFALIDWLNGAELYLMPRWNPSACLNALQELQITHTHCVPTMFNGLLNEPTQPQLPYLQRVLHGAGPITKHTKQQMLNWWGDCLVEYWGGSESGTLTIATAQQWRQYPNTVGKPLASYEVFAVDNEGNKLAANKEGLLFAKKTAQANQRAFKYFNDKEKTDGVFNKEGAFTLGDIGYVNEEGFVFLANRRGDLIISGGANIYPAEIEQVLCNIIGVDDAAVFPVNDDYWGQRPWALVVLHKGSNHDADYLKQQLKTALASYKIPDNFIFTDSIPRSDAGKLYRRYLTKQYQPTT